MIDQPPVFEACICPDFDGEISYDVLEQRTVVAQVRFHCCECKEVIRVGQSFEFIRAFKMWYDDDFGEFKRRHVFQHTCIPCSRILEDDSVFPEGRIYGGVLWELLAEQGFYPERTE